jgi:hypothetical protein
LKKQIDWASSGSGKKIGTQENGSMKKILEKIGFTSLQSLTGKYRFFTGKSLCSNSILTCFGSVQGLKGQISLKYREIYAFCTGISILYLHLCLCFYNRDFPAF